MIDVLIFGAGPAGLSAAIWCKRLDLRPLVLERASLPGGQLNQITGTITDYPGLPDITAPALQQRLAEHARVAGVPVRCGLPPLEVALTDTMVTARAGAEVWTAPYGIIATGTRPRWLGVPGEAEMLARGEIWRGSRDAPRLQGRIVAVVGGGDRAVQNALLVAPHAAQVYLIRRSDRWRARAALHSELADHANITVLSQHRVAAIHGIGTVDAITVVGPDGAPRRLAVDAVLVYIGQQPNSEPFAPWVERTADGRLRCDALGATSHPRLFAAGDVVTPAAYGSVAAAAGQGAVVAKHVALLLQTG